MAHDVMCVRTGGFGPGGYLYRFIFFIWPQTKNVADKAFLEAVTDLTIQYDLSDSSVEQRTFTDLMNIHKQYRKRTKEEEIEAIKFLMGKINNPTKIKWHPMFNRSLRGVDILNAL